MTNEGDASARSDEARLDRTTLHARRAVAGDRDALAWLVERFHPWVAAQVRLRLADAADEHAVEDVAAEVWLVLLGRREDLVPRAGRVTPVLVRFLGTTALQLCNNHLRRALRGATRERLASRVDDVARATVGVVTRAARRDLAGRVARALERLSEGQRDVLVLRLLERKENREIAEVLGVPANTVAQRAKRGLEALRRELPEEEFRELLAE